MNSLPTSERKANSKALLLQAQRTELDEQGLPTFKFESAESPAIEGQWSPLSPDEQTLWRADIRPGNFKTAERNVRRTTTLVTKLIGYAALFAVLLVLLEGMLWAGQLWLGTRTGKIELQSAAVRLIEDKQSLMNKLDQVAQHELRPISMLEAANEIRLKPGKTGIEYDEVVIEGSNRITIEGKANTINELNAYAESLRQADSFELIGDPKTVTRGGKTTFTVTLDYTFIPQQPTPEATEVVEAAATPPTE